jgi:hypothetical protein
MPGESGLIVMVHGPDRHQYFYGFLERLDSYCTPRVNRERHRILRRDPLHKPVPLVHRPA